MWNLDVKHFFLTRDMESGKVSDLDKPLISVEVRPERRFIGGILQAFLALKLHSDRRRSTSKSTLFPSGFFCSMKLALSLSKNIRVTKSSRLQQYGCSLNLRLRSRLVKTIQGGLLMQCKPLLPYLIFIIYAMAQSEDDLGSTAFFSPGWIAVNGGWIHSNNGKLLEIFLN